MSGLGQVRAVLEAPRAPGPAWSPVPGRAWFLCRVSLAAGERAVLTVPARLDTVVAAGTARIGNFCNIDVWTAKASSCHMCIHTAIKYKNNNSPYI